MAQVYGSAGIIAAKITGDSSAMDDVADEVLAAARSEAAKHRDTGAYVRSLEVQNVPGKAGVRDRLVVATDPAAMSIEFGHYPRRAADGSRGQWVPGLFIMINAANKVR